MDILIDLLFKIDRNKLISIKNKLLCLQFLNLELNDINMIIKMP